MTFLPIIALGAFDQDVSEETILLKPELYSVGQKNHDLNTSKMGLHILTAASHSLILFLVVYGTFRGGTITSADGTSDGLYVMGTTLNCCLQLTVNLKILLLSKSVALPTIVIILGSATSWFVFVSVYQQSFSLSDGAFYGVANELFGMSVQSDICLWKCA